MMPNGTNSTTIRLARESDCVVVEDVVAQAYGKYIVRIGRKPGPMLEDYAALIADEAVHLLERDGRIVGLVVLQVEQDAMLLANVAVRPDAQGHGYGRMLLQFAERTAREAGFDLLRLYTHEMMTENQDLYRRNGFVETHRAEEHGLRRVFMSKRLSA